MIQRVSSSCGQISTVLQNSILKKKSNSVSFVIKFSKGQQLISSDAVMVSMAECSVMQSMQRVPKISSFELKFQRESENQCILKSVKKCQNITLEKWVFKDEKI